MQSFNYMSPEGINAVLEAMDRSEEKFASELTRSDFRTLLLSLKFTYDHSSDEELADQAGRLGSSIAETYNIEFI